MSGTLSHKSFFTEALKHRVEVDIVQGVSRVEHVDGLVLHRRRDNAVCVLGSHSIDKILAL